MSSSSPLRMSESGPEKDSEQEAVVRVLRDFCDRVTESEEFVGRFNTVSRFPQYLLKDSASIHDIMFWRYWVEGTFWRTYLITAMLTGAVVLAR